MASNLIIYPTDFSACAENAMPYAIAMAKVMKCNIKIVHSLDIGTVVYEENPSVLLLELEELGRIAERKMRRLKKNIEGYKISCESEVIQGNLTSWLLDNDNPTIDYFIVMGTVGSDDFENKIMGSLASKIIKKTNFPVLVVPRKAQYDNFEKIIFGSNYHKKDFNHLNFLMKITKYFNASLEIVHVFDEEFEDLANDQKVIFSNFKAEVSKKFNYKNLKFTLINSENIEERLSLLLEESNPDLFALISRKRNFIERVFDKSLAKQMAYMENTPILVFS